MTLTLRGRLVRGAAGAVVVELRSRAGHSFIHRSRITAGRFTIRLHIPHARAKRSNAFQAITLRYLGTTAFRPARATLRLRGPAGSQR